MEDTQTMTATIKARKRKLDEALHSIDGALEPTQNDQPSPMKKPRFPGSLYSTLSKYGIKTTREEKFIKPSSNDIVKEKAPRLAAILERTSRKARKIIPFRPPQIASISVASSSAAAVSEYRPSSLSSFLSRLSTYQLATYSNKPSSIDAVAASKHGWTNEGKDRLVCGVCKSSWVLASRDGMSREAANTLLEQQRKGLKDTHKDGCPWKVQQCEDGIYRVPLKSPSTMAKDVKSRALQIMEILQGIEIRHPLSTNQSASLMKAIKETRLDVKTRLEEEPQAESSTQAVTNEATNPQEPTEIAILSALLGWTIAPPQPVSSKTASISRGTSFSISRAGTPASSRASSVAPSSLHAPRTLSSTVSPSISVSAPMPLRPLSYRAASSSASTAISTASGKDKGKVADVLYCELCQRRVGLWTFKNATISKAPNGSQTPRIRPFDLTKEHRPYCPYVVRSTSLPTLPSMMQRVTSTHTRTSSDPSNPVGRGSELIKEGDLVEGWKAVLAVVLRSGLGRRERVRSVGMMGPQLQISDGTPNNNTNAGSQVIDDTTDTESGIQAMVEGVKANGGRELLRYVRSLFS